MSNRLLTLYLGTECTDSAEKGATVRGGYYAIEALKEEPGDEGRILDNPDQRITEDVSSFATTSLLLAVAVLRATIDLAAFSAILYSIYPQLFAVIIIYASVGTYVTVAADILSQRKDGQKDSAATHLTNLVAEMP